MHGCDYMFMSIFVSLLEDVCVRVCLSAVLTTECVYVCVCVCVCAHVRVKVCTLRVVRVNKRCAAGAHVALLSELREKTNCFFTPV